MGAIIHAYPVTVWVLQVILDFIADFFVTHEII